MTTEQVPKSFYIYVCSKCGRQVKPHVDHNLGTNPLVYCSHGKRGPGTLEAVPWERIAVNPASQLEDLIDWHERRAKVKRLNAEQESDPIARATLLGNADTHDVAASVLRRVLDGKPVE